MTNPFNALQGDTERSRHHAEREREGRERDRQIAESRRDGQEQLRQAAEADRVNSERDRVAADGARSRALEAVREMAESLQATLEQMTAVEDMRRTLRALNDPPFKSDPN